MIDLRKITSSDRRWTVAGICALILAIVVLAPAVGIALTRAGESPPVVSAAPLVGLKPKKIVVMGDSYTEGTREGGLGASNWLQLAARQLRREGVDMKLNADGSGGTGYATRGHGGTTFVDEAKRVVEADDDIVMVFGGLNDVETPPEEVRAGVHETLAETRARAPMAQIIVVGPAYPGPDPTPEILQIRDIIADEAAQANVAFTDPIADQWFVNEPQMIGELHPTDEGHRYMAERLLPVLRSALAPPAAPQP
jgi:lysophospholipase L1-like esterase